MYRDKERQRKAVREAVRRFRERKKANKDNGLGAVEQAIKEKNETSAD